MDIPVVLHDLSIGQHSASCTQNPIVANIAQRIPIPRPLTKVNGEIVAHFNGTIAEENQPENESPGSTPQSPPNSSQTPSTPQAANQPQGQVMVPAQTTTIIETATVDAESTSAKQTSLSDSSFGGPGGDLTNEENNSVEEPSAGIPRIQLTLGLTPIIAVAVDIIWTVLA